VVLALSARACLGPSEVTVPVVDPGTTVDVATALLSTGKLDAVRTTQTSTTVPAGRVIAIDPKPGTKLHEGDDVTLFVSAGKPKVTVSSASYAGRSPTAVRGALTALGLVPTLAYDGTGSPAGTVSSVSPAGSLTAGTTITVHVVPVPRTVGGKHGRGKDQKGD